jgi:hypothetical protein
MVERELQNVHTKLNHNKWEIKKLAGEQRVLKSEMGSLYDLKYEITNGHKKVKKEKTSLSEYLKSKE